MKELGIQGRIKHKYTTTTNSKHNNKIYPNLTKNLKVYKINQLWCSDITYIRILNGFGYLAAIIDIQHISLCNFFLFQCVKKFFGF